MANPNIIPAPVNRLLGSVIWTDVPALNVSPSFLLPEAIGLSFNSPVTTNIAGLTSVIPSPEPYIMVEMMIHLIKTMSLAAAYKTQLEAISFLGSCTVRGDTVNMTWSLSDMSILRINPMNFGGHDAGYVITVGGTYNVNQQLWP